MQLRYREFFTRPVRQVRAIPVAVCALRRTGTVKPASLIRRRCGAIIGWNKVQGITSPMWPTCFYVNGAQGSPQSGMATDRFAEREVSQISLHEFVRTQLNLPRYADPKCLTRYGRKVYSQFDEDGILEEIFRRIAPVDRRSWSSASKAEPSATRCGSSSKDGVASGSNKIKALAPRSPKPIHPGSVRAYFLLQTERISAENIDELISRRFSGAIDLLSIDIDYNDYWVWKAIEAVSPRVVVIEYNAAWAPPASITVP